MMIASLKKIEINEMEFSPPHPIKLEVTRIDNGLFEIVDKLCGRVCGKTKYDCVENWKKKFYKRNPTSFRKKV